MNIQNDLCAYISTELLEDDEPLAADENLLADGMVDSMGMLRLVAYIDETWSVTVPPEHFTIENFRTVTAIESYINKRLADTDAG